MKTRRTPASTPAVLAINGIKLDDVRLLLDQEPGQRYIATRAFPESNFTVERTADGLILWLPMPVVLELYRTAVLPQDGKKPIRVSWRGEVASYAILDFRYPEGLSQLDRVTIELRRVTDSVKGDPAQAQ